MTDPAPIDVLLLAAGLGTRLRPLTLGCPKALLPLCGAPLLEHHLRRLLPSPRIGRVVINAHHLAEQIEAFVAGHPHGARLALSREPAILGTGGALAHAAPLLGSDPFLVQNADTFFPFPLEELLAFHRAQRCGATMVLTRSEIWPNVQVEGSRVVAIVRGERVPGALTFAGCHLFSRGSLALIPGAGFQDIRDAFDRLIARGELGAFVWPARGEAPLLEIGTPAAYEEARRLGAEELLRFGLTPIGTGGSAAVRDADRGAAAPIDPGLAAFAARGMALLAGARGAAVRPDGALPPRESGESQAPFIRPLAGDGSTRRIYRASAHGISAVAVENPLPAGRAHPDENEGFLAVREYLEGRGVRVPRLFAADLGAGRLLLEDLGDARLYDEVRARGWRDAHEDLYRTALRQLVLMQAPGDPPFRSARVPNPPYTESFVLEWEARYFHDEMARGVAGLERPFEEIAGECRALAAAAFSPGAGDLPSPGDRDGWDGWTHAEALLAGFTFLHRDYQSRNLMLTAGEVAVIDFQGARWGPPEYDLAALLFDPYVEMPEQARERLTGFYCAQAAAAGVPGVPMPSAATGGPGVPARPDAAWRARFLANAANRLMQALGAYAKLGVRLGRPGFREHIPAGLRLLEAVLAERGDCPRLAALVAEVAERCR